MAHRNLTIRTFALRYRPLGLSPFTKDWVFCGRRGGHSFFRRQSRAIFTHLRPNAPGIFLLADTSSDCEILGETVIPQGQIRGGGGGGGRGGGAAGRARSVILIIFPQRIQ